MTQFRHGNNFASNLSDAEVFTMRQKYASGEYSQAQLAREYGCHINTVGRIVRGETRTKVPMPLDAAASARRLAELQDAQAAQALAKLQSEIQAEKAKPSVDRDLADWERASKYGAGEE